MKTLLATLLLLTLAVSASAGSRTLTWDPAERATGYTLSMTVDGGATWVERDVGNVTVYIWDDAPDDKKAEWKVGAYNETGTAINEWAWVSWDETRKPPEAPRALGVK